MDKKSVCPWDKTTSVHISTTMEPLRLWASAFTFQAAVWPEATLSSRPGPTMTGSPKRTRSNSVGVAPFEKRVGFLRLPVNQLAMLREIRPRCAHVGSDPRDLLPIYLPAGKLVESVFKEEDGHEVAVPGGSRGPAVAVKELCRKRGFSDASFYT